MDFVESFFDERSDHLPDFFNEFPNGDIRSVSTTDDTLEKFTSDNTSIVPVTLINLLVNSLGVVEQLEMVSEIEGKVLLEQGLSGFIVESISVIDLLDFLIISDTISDVLGKGALVNLVFSDKSEIVVGSEVSDNIFEEMEGDLSGGFSEALDDGGGVAQLGLFKQSVQEVLKVNFRIVRSRGNSLLGIDLLSNLTEKLSKRLVHTLIVVEVGSACQLPESCDVKGDVLNCLLFKKGKGSASNVVSNEELVGFGIISHATESGRREALLEILDMDWQVDEIVLSNVLEEIPNKDHSQISSFFIEAVDFLNWVGEIALFPESSKD